MAQNQTLEDAVERILALEEKVATQSFAADTGFILMCSFLVFIMTPGLGYFYSGMARSKNALSLILMCFLSLSVVLIQWALIGFSLSFDTQGGPFIGSYNFFAMENVGMKPIPVYAATIPGSVYCIYQAMFAAITPCLILGSVAERMRIVPTLVFVFCWTTLVYDPIACWTWGANGWLRLLGGLDFAGGTPVHISSGFAGLAFAIVLGKRHGFGKDDFKPHHMSNVFLGTTLLWFGWFGFNGGSALASNARAALAAWVTTIATAAGSITWTFLDYRSHGKFSGLAFCSGAVAGMVTITPAAGFVTTLPAIAIGFCGALACYFGCKMKHLVGFDDALDAFGVHGLGGFVGCILTGVFADNYVYSLDGSAPVVLPSGGWINHNFRQVAIQLAAAVAGAAYSFTMTCVILVIMNRVPGLRLRVDHQEELLGLDLAHMGEAAYDFGPGLLTNSSKSTFRAVAETPQILATQVMTQDRKIHIHTGLKGGVDSEEHLPAADQMQMQNA